MSASAKGGDLFIVDNSDAEWKVQWYLKEWNETESNPVAKEIKIDWLK